MARHLHVWRSHYLSGSSDFPSPSPFTSVTSGLTQLPDAASFISRVRYGRAMSVGKLREEDTSSQAGRATAPQGDVQVSRARLHRSPPCAAKCTIHPVALAPPCPAICNVGHYFCCCFAFRALVVLVIWETFKHSECQVQSIAQGVELALAG